MSTYYVQEPDCSNTKYRSFASQERAREYAAKRISKEGLRSVNIYFGINKNKVFGSVVKQGRGLVWMSDGKMTPMFKNGRLRG